MTRGAVRCSAWLGVDSRSRIEPPRNAAIKWEARSASPKGRAVSEANAIRTLDNLSPRREGKARLPFIRSRLQKAFAETGRERPAPKPKPPKLANNPRNGDGERLTFIADGEKRLTTPSSATAERGAVAAKVERRRRQRT